MVESARGAFDGKLCGPDDSLTGSNAGLFNFPHGSNQSVDWTATQGEPIRRHC